MSKATLQNVHQLASAGKLIEADRACRQILQLNPGNMAAARVLGQITRRTAMHNNRQPDIIGRDTGLDMHVDEARGAFKTAIEFARTTSN